MLSFVLQHQSSHSILFPSQGPRPLLLRVFGCACFVHDPTPKKVKLQPKSIKCVFLGYSYFQKGYKCYNQLSNKYFVSSNITFFEISRYFLPNTANTHLISSALLVPIVTSSPLYPPLQASLIGLTLRLQLMI